jgi:predicted Zn-dependent protease
MFQVYTKKTTWMTQRMNDIANNPYYNSDKRDFKALIEDEKIQQVLFANSFSSRDATWWQNEITNLHVQSSNTSVAAESAKRLLNYISMLGYIYTDNAIKSGATDAANHYLQIYQLDDPQNPDVFYLNAVLAMSQGRTEQALSLLQQSASLGLTDIHRLQQEQVFASIRQRQEYSQVVNEVVQNIQK